MNGRFVAFGSCESQEVQRIFFSEMKKLLQPAYFLTGSHEQAAECFLEAWETCRKQPPAIGQNPRCAATTAIVRAAIRKIAPDVQHSAAAVDSNILTSAKTRRPGSPKHLDAQMFRQEILSLNAFRRAALVLRLYEGYSSNEAAFLLQISRSTLKKGWQQALLCLLEQLNSSGAAASRQNRETILEPDISRIPA